MTLRIDRVVESSLYVDDLEAARRFYGQVLGLELVGEEPGRHLFFRCGTSMVLLFLPESTATGQGAIPAHGAHGPGHLAFAMEIDAAGDWRRMLEARGVEIESDVTWPHGGRSLYIRDPSGNSVELVTPQIWGL